MATIKSTVNWFIIFAFVALSLSAEATNVKKSMVFSDKRLQKLTSQLDKYVDSQQLAGGVVLIKHKGKDVYHHAFGQQNVKAKQAMKKDSIFRIASQTKAIVSVAVLMLQEQGKLLIQDPVSRYLPEFKTTYVAQPDNNTADGYVTVKAKRQITIRDLLMHTSGIGYGHGLAKQQWQQSGIQGWYFSGTTTPMREVVKSIARLPQDNQPGNAFVYGYSTDILGVMVEQITGMPLSQYLKMQIFEPLKMTDTHFYLPEEKHARLTTVYSADPDGKIIEAPAGAREQTQGLYHTKGDIFSAGAGLVSTAADYGRFLQMLLNGGALDGQRLLSPLTVDLMTTNHLNELTLPWEQGVGFGLGFSVVTDVGSRGVVGSSGEYGWGGAYHSSYWVDPKQDIIAIYLTQLLPAGQLDDHGKFRALLYQSLVPE
jgi:CubicO group peptidase (beta-lactamase class C family)